MTIKKAVISGVALVWLSGFGIANIAGQQGMNAVHVANTHVEDPIQSYANDGAHFVNPVVQKFSTSTLNQMFSNAEGGHQSNVGNQIQGKFDNAINKRN